jgi:hypothetical protein
MVDNVLLEKRNRYLGKLIKKTQNLTESVKLLSIIDKELYSQSGGTFTQAIEKLRNPVVVYTNGTDSLTGLKDVVNQLQTTIQNFSNFEQKLQHMAPPVVYVKVPTNLSDIQLIIDKIKESLGVLDKHEIIIITNFLTNEKFNNAANKYAESVTQYNTSTDPSEKDRKKLLDDWNTLQHVYEEYVSYNKSHTEILKAVFDWIYEKPPFNESELSRTGSSSLAGPSSSDTVGERNTGGKVQKRSS